MAHDEAQADRLRSQLADTDGVVGRRMFGGVAFMLNGHMTVGVSGPDMIGRVGAESYEATSAPPGTSGSGPAGRTMKGWILVDAGAVEAEADLADWVQTAVSFTVSLEPK